MIHPIQHFGLAHKLNGLWKGQSIARVLMNEALAHECVEGRVLDVGGGRRPDYFNYLQGGLQVTVEIVDGSVNAIDFETDALPFADNSFNTILACNVLEHIYNHQFLLREMHRILKPGGQLIGFVPFWVGYHPDPRDYFRYTDEALMRMLIDVGYATPAIKKVGGGPCIANFNTVVLSFPRVVRPLMYLWYASVDALFLYLRPSSANRNPLGYIFTAVKQDPAHL